MQSGKSTDGDKRLRALLDTLEKNWKDEIIKWLEDPAACEALRVRFEAIHRELRQDTAKLATDAIEAVLKS